MCMMAALAIQEEEEKKALMWNFESQKIDAIEMEMV